MSPNTIHHCPNNDGKRRLANIYDGLDCILLLYLKSHLLFTQFQPFPKSSQVPLLLCIASAAIRFLQPRCDWLCLDFWSRIACPCIISFLLRRGQEAAQASSHPWPFSSSGTCDRAWGFVEKVEHHWPMVSIGNGREDREWYLPTGIKLLCCWRCWNGSWDSIGPFFRETRGLSIFQEIVWVW